MDILELPCSSTLHNLIKSETFRVNQNQFAALLGTCLGACHAGDLGSIPESGRSFGEGNGYPLQHSCLENSMEQWSLVSYTPWGCKESDTTERLILSLGMC